ncbi:MAG: hypothetical protein FWG05_04365, partial [Kiritimatiellaeota bacterium]|nr:hypothetical protein [Kiritimatiellota bacterium]
EFLPFPFERARWVGLRIKSHYGRDNNVGFYKIQFFESQDTGVILDSLEMNASGTLDFSGELFPADENIPTHIVACYGETDGGDDFGAWDTKKDFGVTPAGAFAYQLTGLSAGCGYYFALAATNGASADGWSRAQPFITDTVSVDSPGDFYKSDSGMLVFRRPSGTANVPLAVAYSVGGDAIPGTHYETLSGIVFFDENIDEVHVPVVPKVAVFNGDKTVTISVLGGNCLTDSSSSCSFVIRDNESGGSVKEWSGEGDNTSWNLEENWIGGVPSPADTALFGSHVQADTVVALGANRGVYKILIDTTEPFAIGDAGTDWANSLAFVEIERTAGSSFTHEISVPVKVVPTGTTGFSAWKIGGESNLVFNAAIATLNAPVVKTGAGTVEFNSTNYDFTDTFHCREGVLNLTAYSALRGDLFVGGGENPARMNAKVNAVITGYKNVTALTNGHVSAVGTQQDYDTVAVWAVEDNGFIEIGWSHYPIQYKFRGGVIDGGWGWNAREIMSFSHSEMALLKTMHTCNWHAQFFIYVERGTAPIDLRIAGDLRGDPNFEWWGYILKNGNGILQRTGVVDMTRLGFYIDEGTVLFDNPDGTSGNGDTPVYVRYGATVGGCGFLGGTERGDILLTDSNADAQSSIEPGTKSEFTGEHIIGTLTVGTVLTNNVVTLGDYSGFRASIGENLTNDLLNVFGEITISETGTTLEITVAPEAKAGAYIIASATTEIVGKFAEVLVDGETTPRLSRRVSYTGNEVIYTIPSMSSLIIIK